MPTIRKHQTAIINEWRLDEVAGAFDVPAHRLNVGHTSAKGDCTIANRNQMMAKSGEWYGYLSSVEAAAELMRGGWSDGVRKLERLANSVTPPTVQSRVRRVAWRDQGDELSVDRAMRGEFDTAWRTSRRVWTSGPTTVDVYTIYGGAASLTAEQVFWNGACAVVTADKLEAAGYRVRLVASFLHSGEDGDEDGRCDRFLRSDVILKEADEPLRADAIASVLCHAGVYRTFLFRTWCCAPVKLDDGLGPAIYSWTPAAIAALKAAGEWPEGAVVIDRANSESECRREIERIVATVQSA